MGSEAKQGIAAFVPRRSLTITVIIGSEGGAGAAAFFFFLSRRASSSGRPRSRSPSRCLSRSRSASLSLRGDRPRSSLSRYPRSSLRSSRPDLVSSSRLLSFHRNPPPGFLGRSLSVSVRLPGDRLLARSSIVSVEGGWIVISKTVDT